MACGGRAILASRVNLVAVGFAYYGNKSRTADGVFRHRGRNQHHRGLYWHLVLQKRPFNEAVVLHRPNDISKYNATHPAWVGAACS